MRRMEPALVAGARELSFGPIGPRTLEEDVAIYADAIRGDQLRGDAACERIVDDIEAGDVSPIVGTLALQLMGI